MRRGQTTQTKQRVMGGTHVTGCIHSHRKRHVAQAWTQSNSLDPWEVWAMVMSKQAIQRRLRRRQSTFLGYSANESPLLVVTPSHSWSHRECDGHHSLHLELFACARVRRTGGRSVTPLPSVRRPCFPADKSSAGGK